jgi:hypothetical protein
MADLSVPFVDEVATKGMEEGNAEVRAQGLTTWLDHLRHDSVPQTLCLAACRCSSSYMILGATEQR